MRDDVQPGSAGPVGFRVRPDERDTRTLGDAARFQFSRDEQRNSSVVL